MANHIRAFVPQNQASTFPATQTSLVAEQVDRTHALSFAHVSAQLATEAPFCHFGPEVHVWRKLEELPFIGVIEDGFCQPLVLLRSSGAFFTEAFPPNTSRLFTTEGPSQWTRFASSRILLILVNAKAVY